MLKKISKDVFFSLPVLFLALVLAGWWLGRLWVTLVQADELTALRMTIDWPAHAEAGQSGIISL